MVVSAGEQRAGAVGGGRGEGGGEQEGAELIFISVQRGLEGGVNLHVSFATDPSHRRDNGRELKYCPQVLTLLRRSGGRGERAKREGKWSRAYGRGRMCLLCSHPFRPTGMYIPATVVDTVGRVWVWCFRSEILKTFGCNVRGNLPRGIYLRYCCPVKCKSGLKDAAAATAVRVRA